MNDDELMLKAQGYLNSVLRHPLFQIGIAPEEFTAANKLGTPTTIVRFTCKKRADAVDLILNAETGDFITMLHLPPKAAQDRRD